MPYRRACLISGCALAMFHCMWLQGSKHLERHVTEVSTFNILWDKISCIISSNEFPPTADQIHCPSTSVLASVNSTTFYLPFDIDHASPLFCSSYSGNLDDNSLTDLWPYTWDSKMPSASSKLNHDETASQVLPDINLSINISQCWPGLPSVLVGKSKICV